MIHGWDCHTLPHFFFFLWQNTRNIKFTILKTILKSVQLSDI